MNLTASWCFWALLSAFFAALTAVFAKIGMRGLDSVFATFVTACLIVVMLLAFVPLAGKWTNPSELSSKTWAFLSLAAFAIGASWVCYFRALKIGDASKVAPVDKLSLLLVVLFGVLFFGERPAPREWMGIAMIGAGVLFMATKS
jgi:bacterial/archaeal transporter family protein